MKQTTQQQKVPTHVRKHVEAGLRNAEANRRRLEQIFANIDNPDIEATREDIILSGGTSFGEIIKIIGEAANPVLSKALLLLTIEVSLSTILFLNATEKALHTHPECIPLYHMYYCDGWTRVKICNDEKASRLAPMSDSTFYYLRNKLVRQIASDLGWMD